MAITPEQIDAEIARREALSSGQTFTSVGGVPAQTTTELPPPGGYATTPGQAAALAPQVQDAPGTQGAQVPIPPSAQDPVEAEIQRRERVSRPSSGPNALQRFDEGVLSLAPPNLRATLSAVGRVGANFNDTLAKYLGATPDAADEILQKVGVRLFDKPNATANEIRGFMRDAGIPVERTNDLEGQVGRGLFEGTIQSAAWFAALPKLLALGGIQAGSTAGEVFKKLAEYAQKNPALFTAQNVGAGVGATVAEEEIGGPLATLAGGAAGSLIPGMAGTVARGITYPVRAVGRALFPNQGPSQPVLPPGTRLNAPREFATAERDAQLARLDAERQARIAASGPADPAAASAQFSQSLDAAEQGARQHMRGLYAPWADMPVDPAITVNRMARLVRDITPSEGAGPNFPRDWAERIDQLYVRRIPAAQPPAAVPFGQPLPTVAPARIEIIPTTLDDLVNLRSDLLREAANARRGAAGTPANYKRARYLNRLAQGVQENIDAATHGTPAEAGMQAATQFARQYYNLFERGVVGRTYTPETGRREGAVPPEGLAEEMLRTGRNQGRDAFSQVTAMTQLPGVGQGNYPTLQAAESAVRAIFRQAAEASPLGAERWFAQNRRQIGSLAQTAHDLESTATRLSQIHATERGLQNDALTRFIGPDHQNAFARIFGSPDPAREARDLMRTMRVDGAALQGFKAGVVEHIMRASNMSPSAAAKMLSEPAINRMVREVLDPAEYKRFGDIVRAATSLELGARRVGGRAATWAATAGMAGGLGMIDPTFAVGAASIPIIARIVGAQMGTTIAHAVGRGNIQTPAIVSGIMRNWATDTFGGISAAELFARAVRDPRWEAVLLRKAPTTDKEARAFAKTVRRLISTTHAITNQANPTEGEEE